MSTIDLYNDEGFVATELLPSVISGTNATFKLGKVLRQGGNGIVLEANRRAAGGDNLGKCAVKFLKHLGASRADRFQNEARVLEQLDHHRISKYFANGAIQLGPHKVPWIALELGGENLRRHVDANGPLASHVLQAVAIQAAQAIGHLHSIGFIHRDVKPENFVWDGAAPESIQMIDFGLAKRVGEDVSARPLDQFTQQAEFVGPVFFSSPELIAYATNKAESVDERSDLFQLGKTLWYLATGRISAGCPNARHCPMGGALHRLVVELLDDDPDGRPATALEVEKRLHTVFGVGQQAPVSVGP